MDVYDLAAQAAQQYQGTILAVTDERPLTPFELEALVEHLLGTEMPVQEALRALHFGGARRLTLDDIDKLCRLVAPCRYCATWTRLPELAHGLCPTCHQENS
jgi:hypothetical protein